MSLATHNSYSHVYREGSRVADAIVNEGFTLMDFTWCYSFLESAKPLYLRNLQIRIKIDYTVRIWCVHP